MEVLSDNIFWTVSTASPRSCFNKEGQNIFLSKGVRKRYKKGKNGIFGPNSICFVNKKNYGMDEGGISDKWNCSSVTKYQTGNLSLVIVWRWNPKKSSLSLHNPWSQCRPNVEPSSPPWNFNRQILNPALQYVKKRLCQCTQSSFA